MKYSLEQRHRALASRLASAATSHLDSGFDRLAVVLNPRAGALNTGRKLRGVERQVEGALAGSAAAPAPTSAATGAGRIDIFITEERGHGREIGRQLGAGALSADRSLLLLSAGGDGAHGEIVNGLLESGTDALTHVTIHRMPLGTGNDGADAATLEESLQVLLHGGAPERFPVLQISGPGLGPHYACNIASFGLDAYVSLLTNKLKGRVPGDSYKFLADLATLFYEPLIGVPEQQLTVTEQGGATVVYRNRYMLCAIGVSGNRSYGAGKPILPGPANLCAIQRVGLRGKLRIKRAVYSGEHLSDPAVISERVSRLQIYSAASMPMQIDGEAQWISPGAFPIRCSVIPDAMHALRNRVAVSLDTGVEGHTESPL